jgi:hypothetical protein
MENVNDDFVLGVNTSKKIVCSSRLGEKSLSTDDSPRNLTQSMLMTNQIWPHLTLLIRYDMTLIPNALPGPVGSSPGCDSLQSRKKAAYFIIYKSNLLASL